MPRVIVKCRYYSSEKSVRDVSGLLNYIGTRPGVDKTRDSLTAKPVSKAQEELILHFTEKYKNCKSLSEYAEYNKYRTKGTASEFIAAVIESHPDLLSEKTYLDYIATRPRAERIEGTHGLFTDDGKTISLSAEAERLRNHNGNVFTVIVSLKREDAERLGYNTAERWRDLARSKIDLIAKEHQIPIGSLQWYGAFHNEAHHPHMHLMLYSENKEESGYIDKKGIDNLRHLFGTEIFKYELADVYDDQYKQRRKLTSLARDEIKRLSANIPLNLSNNNEFIIKFSELSKRLQKVSGKKTYGYLPKNVKASVNELVDFLEKDEDIAAIYELWYKAKCAVYATYTDNPPPKKPLSQEEAFKPIRNAMIKEANELGQVLTRITAEKDNQGTSSQDTTSEDQDKHRSESINTDDNERTNFHTTNSKHHYSKHNDKSIRNGYIATSITRFGNSLSRIFSDRFDEQAKHAPVGIDSRLQREIEAKKKGQP